MDNPLAISYASIVLDKQQATAIQAGINEVAEARGRMVHPFAAEYVADHEVLREQRWIKGIISYTAFPKIIEKLRPLRLPVINVSASLDKMPFPSVLNDEKEMGRMAAAHLLDCGARSVLHVTADGAFPTGFRRLRLEGVEAACAEAGAEGEHFATKATRKRDVLEDVEEQVRQIEAWLETKRPPLAVVAADPRTGRIVARAASRMGWELGQEIALIQITSPKEDLRFGHHGISYVGHNWPEVGRQAATALFRWVEEGVEPRPLQWVPPLPPVLTSSSDSSSGSGWVTRVHSFLLHSNDYGMTAEEVATRLNVSLRTLNRSFQRERGHSLKRELLRRKLEHGRDLLGNTALSVTDIAARCGYGAAQTFSSSFRKEYGAGPSEYRRRGEVKTKA